jgi:hypothetical protein
MLLLAGRLTAGIRPSFDWRGLSWNSSAIVVVTEAGRSGLFNVTETWKGKLTPGELIEVPGMIAFQTRTARAIPNSTELGNTFVTTSRLVLFLKQSGSAGDGNPDAASTWIEASKFGGMMVSFAWLEGSDAFAYVQRMNPGETLLTSLGMSEADLHLHVLEVLQEQKSFETAAAISPPQPRADALTSFLSSRFFSARQAAIEELRRCGKPALPSLWKVILDDAKIGVHGDAIKLVGELGGQYEGAALTALLQSELSFWQQTGPRLQPGWWNHLNKPETEFLRFRYGAMIETIRALDFVQYEPCWPVVSALSQFWTSLPQLNDPSGLDQLSEECNELISKLHGRRGSGEKPAILRHPVM